MCSCDFDEDMPSCFMQKRRRARKQHSCVECKRVIYAGSTYEYSSGIWDGQPDSFKTCLRCVNVRTAHINAEKSIQKEDRISGPEYMKNWSIISCSPIIGHLFETIRECIHEDNKYIKFFRDSYRILRRNQ